jgi:hypothetical protein
VERTVERKAMATRKLKDEPSKAALSTHPAAAKTAPRPKPGRPVRPQLEKAISELQGLNGVLLSGDLDPRVLAVFRDAVNRVRTAAWAAQQYLALKETDEGSSGVLGILAAERVRATYQLCLSIGEDLKRPETEVPAGSLIQLYEVMSALTEQLKGVVKRLG